MPRTAAPCDGRTDSAERESECSSKDVVLSQTNCGGWWRLQMQPPRRRPRARWPDVPKWLAAKELPGLATGGPRTRTGCLRGTGTTWRLGAMRKRNMVPDSPRPADGRITPMAGRAATIHAVSAATCLRALIVCPRFLRRRARRAQRSDSGCGRVACCFEFRSGYRLRGKSMQEQGCKGHDESQGLAPR